jgi:hypothetical protein
MMCTGRRSDAPRSDLLPIGEAVPEVLERGMKAPCLRPRAAPQASTLRRRVQRSVLLGRASS